MNRGESRSVLHHVIERFVDHYRINEVFKTKLASIIKMHALHQVDSSSHNFNSEDVLYVHFDTETVLLALAIWGDFI